MAQVMIEGYDAFGYDGVQLSLGVTGEAEALGARVTQPEDGLPKLEQVLLAEALDLDSLRTADPTTGGRMLLFYEAVQRVVQEIGDQAYVLATLRGPLLAASQLRGVEQIMIDLATVPEQVVVLLEFTSRVIFDLGRWLLASGAHGLLLGEATCSPSFISPTMYRDIVLPFHKQLVGSLHEAGWATVGLHICGNTTPILADIASTRVDFADIDYQVSLENALRAINNGMCGRGNLDPSAIFRFGSPSEVRAATACLCEGAYGKPWIVSSGCDIPPGTPWENIEAFVQTAAVVLDG
jgi:MtaA/CmuA family methyltransferase